MSGVKDPNEQLTSDLPPLREVIRRHDLAARKDLGQHFLLDRNLTDRIARSAIPPGADDLSAGTVIEIGPGPGGLTRSLLRLNARVLALDVDVRAIAAMEDLAAMSSGRLIAVEADALETDVAEEADRRGLPSPYRIVANLPYNVGTAMLVRWLHTIDRYDGFVLMFQREVVDRLIAEPGSKAYGRLSVLTQWLCHTRRLFTVPAAAFTPPPNVVSAVVSLHPRNQPLALARLTHLESVTAAAFGQRRKMLRQSLKSLFDDPGATLPSLGIDPTARAETLTVEQFCTIARRLEQPPGK